MVKDIVGIISLIKESGPEIVMLLAIWGIFDNYLLTRYGGKVNRGFTIWSQILKSDEIEYLMGLTEDVVDVKSRRFGLHTKTKTDFIMKSGSEALIRFNHMGQRTSWSLVGFVELSALEPHLEFRLSLPMLLASMSFMFFGVAFVVIFLIAFSFSWLFETGGLRNYLSNKVDLSFVKKTSQIRQREPA